MLLPSCFLINLESHQVLNEVVDYLEANPDILELNEPMDSEKKPSVDLNKLFIKSSFIM